MLGQYLKHSDAASGLFFARHHFSASFLGSTAPACDVVIADTGFIAIGKFGDFEGGFTDGPAPGWDKLCTFT